MDTEELEEVASILESIANMLRGMTLDPAIPYHAKNVMQAQIQVLEELVERMLIIC